MLQRNWKKIGMLILIIACIFNIMGKLVNKQSLKKEQNTWMRKKIKNNTWKKNRNMLW